jgi:hypothetical protein
LDHGGAGRECQLTRSGAGRASGYFTRPW